MKGIINRKKKKYLWFNNYQKQLPIYPDVTLYTGGPEKNTPSFLNSDVYLLMDHKSRC